MNTPNNHDLKALFHACEGLSQADQMKVIADSPCDEATKARVLKLLNYEGDIDQALTQLIQSTAQKTLNHQPLTPGLMVEQYRLQKPIGEGGQGEVWLAERHDGAFTHQVAIKFIKLSPTETEWQRFENERELLASLQHPNIAGLIGGGQLYNRLYMILEWIDGRPLFQYLKQEQLNLAQTLHCFLQVCHAVSHAHSQGIIHRDLKPSNILVTNDGLVKLLDFGIAKTISQDITQTQSAVLMTLAYSSPEQVNGQAVTTATDVYALGLILYEILTSQKAQAHTTETPALFFKAITDDNPNKPSATPNTRFGSRQLQGDLDNLVMMAIRKEPNRRYPNADALIADINNYLNSRPLQASGDGLLYQGSKLIKRNPLAASLITMVLVFLIALPIILFQHSQALEVERDKANQQAQISRQTTSFLTTLFESASPLGKGGQTIDLNSILAQGERQLTNDEYQDPNVIAALSMVMGTIQHHLENRPKAIAHYQKARTAFQQAKDAAGELAALSQEALMHFRHDDLKATESTFAAAEALVTTMDDPIAVAWFQLRKATVASERGEEEQAIEWASQALAIAQDVGSEDPALLGRIHSELGEAMKYTDKEQSLIHNAQSLYYAEQEVGKIHPYYLGRLSSRAVRLMRVNRHKEAQMVIDETIRTAEKLYSDDHPKYATYLGPKAVYTHDKGHFDQTEVLYHKIRDIFEKHYGKLSYDYARLTNNLAYLYEDMGQLSQAESLYSESIDLRIQLDPDNQIRIATTQSNLARLLAKVHKHEASAAILNDIMPIFSAHQRDNLYNHITQMANAFGDGTNAEACENGLIKLTELTPQIRQVSDKSWKRLGAELWIGQILRSCQLKSQAKDWLDSALLMSVNIYAEGSLGRQWVRQVIDG